MNSRERVLKAWKVMEGNPDRVPVQFDLCRQLLDHFGKELNIPVNYTDNLFEDVTYRISGNEIRLALGSDVVVTGAGTSKEYKKEIEADGTWLNEYGMRMRQGAIYVDVLEYPLANCDTSADLSGFKLPDPNAPGRYEDAEKLIAQYKNDYLIIGDIEVTILSLVQMLVGMEKMMIDMMLEADYLPPLIRMVTDFQTEIGINLIKRGVDAIWVGDDLGSQTNLLFPPDIFRDLWKPYYVEMCNKFKAANPDILLLLHCDGAVSTLIPDFCEIGFHVFNPVQPDVPGHGPQELKDQFGEVINFWGAIDQQYLLPNGTDAELEADIQAKIKALGKDKGYMISPAHIIQSDVSPERVKKFVELCVRNGTY